MKISVVVTVYNRFEYLKNLIICLNKQIVKPYELIIADDGSSEKVEDILCQFDKFDYKIKHAYQEDKGFRLAASRNNGFKHSEAEYVLFLDQDVIFDETFLETICLKAKKGTYLKFNAVWSNREEKNEIQKQIEENRPYKEYLTDEQRNKNKKAYRKELLNKFLYKLKLRKRAAKLIGLAFGVWREDFIKINGFDQNYEGWGYEDDDFGNRLTAAGIYGIPLITKNPIIHMFHEFSATKKEKLNEKYYREKRKESLYNRKYICENGLNKLD